MAEAVTTPKRFTPGGPGRPKGSKNKRDDPTTRALMRMRTDYNADPLQCVGMVLREAKERWLAAKKEGKVKALNYAEERLLEATKIALPYCYPRLRTTHVDLGEAKSFEIKVEL